jgi:hypothetical protein
MLQYISNPLYTRQSIVCILLTWNELTMQLVCNLHTISYVSVFCVGLAMATWLGTKQFSDLLHCGGHPTFAFCNAVMWSGELAAYKIRIWFGHWSCSLSWQCLIQVVQTSTRICEIWLKRLAEVLRLKRSAWLKCYGSLPVVYELSVAEWWVPCSLSIPVVQISEEKWE